MGWDDFYLAAAGLGINLFLGRRLKIQSGEEADKSRARLWALATGASLGALMIWPLLAAERAVLGVLSLSALLQLLGLSFLQLLCLIRAGAKLGSEDLNPDPDHRCPDAPSA